MNIQEAQADMRKAYLRGATGAVASGCIWLSAGIVALFSTPLNSTLVLFFGGMMIFPLSILLSKALKRSGKTQKGNPLVNLALESTLLLFIGLFIAFVVFQVQPDWFYPIMLLIIGGRYVIFNSLYGLRIYWIFGLVLILAGVGTFVLNAPFHVGALLGGGIEILFALLIFNIKD